MGMTKAAMMEKRAEMKTFAEDARRGIWVKYAGAEVTKQLCEVIQEDMLEKLAEQEWDIPLPEVTVERTGTGGVEIKLKFD